MTVFDENLCLTEFSSLCDEIGDSSIIGLEDCQYWLFERGFKAALESQAADLALGATKTLAKIESVEKIALH